MSNGSSANLIEAIYLGVFDIFLGPVIRVIEPASPLSSLIKENFDQSSSFIIPETNLSNTFVKLELNDELCVISYSFHINTTDYERNKFAFNVALVMSKDKYARKPKMFERGVKTIAKFFLKMEIFDFSVYKKSPVVPTLLRHTFLSLNEAQRVVLHYQNIVSYITLLEKNPAAVSGNALVLCRKSLFSSKSTNWLNPYHPRMLALLIKEQSKNSLLPQQLDAFFLEFQKHIISEFRLEKILPRLLDDSRVSKKIANAIVEFFVMLEEQEMVYLIKGLNPKKKFGLPFDYVLRITPEFVSQLKEFVRDVSQIPDSVIDCLTNKRIIECLTKFKREISLEENFELISEDFGAETHINSAIIHYVIYFCYLKGIIKPLREFYHLQRYDDRSISSVYEANRTSSNICSFKIVNTLLKHLNQEFLSAEFIIEAYDLSQNDIDTIIQVFDVTKILMT